MIATIVPAQSQGKEFMATPPGEGLRQIVANSQSFSLGAINNHLASSKTPAPPNIETNSYPVTFEQIQQTRSRAHRSLGRNLMTMLIWSPE
jgi:hypothetical protein